jgi:zinc/manganese transport system ATP-binding protein
MAARRPGRPQAGSAGASGPALSVEGLSVVLGGREVLTDVTFSVGPGELTGLIGANGAGKTTLLRAILGLQPAAAGRVSLGGGEPGRAAVGYVPQKVLLDPDLPVRAVDLVALGLPSRPLRPSRERHAVVSSLLAAVDAGHLATKRVGALSGGEQQRVLIAHALARRPTLLLLDEPLANLDIRSTQETVTLLCRIARDQKVGVLLSAHDINPLLPVMDRVVYLAGGRAASGPAADVVRGEVLSRLYGHHVDVFHAHGRVIVSVGESPQEGGCELGPDEDHSLFGPPAYLPGATAKRA